MVLFITELAERSEWSNYCSVTMVSARLLFFGLGCSYFSVSTRSFDLFWITEIKLLCV